MNALPKSTSFAAHELQGVCGVKKSHSEQTTGVSMDLFRPRIAVRRDGLDVSDDPKEDTLLRRYLRCVNCAEELRILAASKADGAHRDMLLTAAGCLKGTPG